MTAIKAHQAEQFLKAIEPRYQAILFYGNDAGLVSERASRTAQRLAAATKPPGEILRIEDADLETEPDRLLVEVQTLPMFGGPKVVHTRASRRVNAQLLRPLIEQGTLAAKLIVEAGNLKPDEAMRALFEKSGSAAAVGCYIDESRDLDSLVRDTLRNAGVSISPEAQQVLVSRLGADRVLTRGELEKLILYAQGKPQIDIDDVEAVVGDASELAIDKVVLAAASGQPNHALAEFDRVVAAGDDPQAIIIALQRHFQRLHLLRAGIDSGRSLDEVLKRIRPPVHFKVKSKLEAQCRIWSTDALIAAISRIGAAAKTTRLERTLELALTERLILDLAGMAKSRQPGATRRA